MFRRLASTVLVITVLSLSLTPVYAASDNKKQAQSESLWSSTPDPRAKSFHRRQDSDWSRNNGRGDSGTNPDSYSPGPHPATA